MFVYLDTCIVIVDSLHLAAAIELGCDRLLTNDARLNNFPEISVEILP
jgi:predicted nucleic acid-binding protein